MGSADKSKGRGVVAASSGNDQDADSKLTLDVKEVLGESHDRTIARVRMHPAVQAASTMLNFDKALGKHKFLSLTQELDQHEKDVKAGNMGRAESILINQANTLDVIFNMLAARAGANVGSHADAADRYLRMALKAQSQCRTTLEALAEIKMPKSATFIRQFNAASQQQVNNGNVTNGGSAPVPAHGKNSDNSANELLEVSDGERMDGGATCPTGRTDSHLEAVGAVDRPKKRGRKNAQ